jgi:hypothetical protein
MSRTASVEEVAKSFSSEDTVDKMKKRELFRTYQKDALSVLEKRVLNDVIYTKYDTKDGDDLIFPLIDKMTLEQIGQSREFIFTLMVTLNKYCICVHTQGFKSTFPLIKVIKNKEIDVYGAKIKSRVAVGAVPDEIKAIKSRINKMIEEAEAYAYYGDDYGEFSPHKLLKELKSYKGFLNYEKEKYNFSYCKESDKLIKMIVEDKFDTLGVENYKKVLDNFTKALSQTLFKELYKK